MCMVHNLVVLVHHPRGYGASTRCAGPFPRPAKGGFPSVDGLSMCPAQLLRSTSWALTLLEVRFVGHTMTGRVLETFRHQTSTPKLVRTFSTQAISSRGISDDEQLPQPVVSRVAAIGTCFGLTGNVPETDKFKLWLVSVENGIAGTKRCGCERDQPTSGRLRSQRRAWKAKLFQY